MQVDSWKEAWNESPGPKSRVEFIYLYLKGFLMGIADLIPGVSGGTIAFVTGIYTSLLNAVASVDKNFFMYLLKFDFKSALSKVHLRFLLPVFFGIATAMITLARLMHYLMNEHPIPTWGAFFGLIAASIVVIIKQLDDKLHSNTVVLMILGVVVGHFSVTLIPVETPEEYWFIYLCGIISITAMILPGISGSFLLLILGKYEYVTGALKNPFGEGALPILIIFLCGTVSGLLGFSKVLNWFMNNYRNRTMALLTGILIGTMEKVWPWKEVLETTVIRGKTKILREVNFFPQTYGIENTMTFLLIVICFVAVLILESKSRVRSSVG